MKNETGKHRQAGRHFSAMALAVLISMCGNAFAASAAGGDKAPSTAKAKAAATLAATQPAAVPSSPPTASLSMDQAKIGPELNLFIGKSTLLRLPDPIDRISVGN